MENGPFEDVFPIQKWGFSIAVLVYHRVNFNVTADVFFGGFVEGFLLAKHLNSWWYKGTPKTQYRTPTGKT